MEIWSFFTSNYYINYQLHIINECLSYDKRNDLFQNMEKCHLSLLKPYSGSQPYSLTITPRSKIRLLAPALGKGCCPVGNF